MCAPLEVTKHAELVGGQRLVGDAAKPDVVVPGASLLDLHHAAGGKVEQRCRHRLVRDPEAVDEEVRDRRRFRAGLERARPDGRVVGLPREVQHAPGEQPHTGRDDRRDEEQILIAAEDREHRRSVPRRAAGE